MQLDGRTVTVLHANVLFPPIIITGWPEGVRLLRPKALNKSEQLLLQDALSKRLVSMTCLQGKREGSFLAEGSANGLEQPESTTSAEGDDVGQGPPSGAGVWAGPLSKQASQLF
jgi:hypothetical protein